jgi:hypothetical protein
MITSEFTFFLKLFIHLLAIINLKVTLEQAMKAQRGVEVKLNSFFNRISRWGWVVNATPWPL